MAKSKKSPTLGRTCVRCGEDRPAATFEVPTWDRPVAPEEMRPVCAACFGAELLRVARLSVLRDRAVAAGRPELLKKLVQSHNELVCSERNLTRLELALPGAA